MMGALAALADRPHHQRLAAAHVAASEHLGERARIGRHVGLDVAARVALEAESSDHALVHGMHEAHGEEDELGLALDPRGNVKADTLGYQSSIPKVFAAGDMRRGQSLVVWAIREGRQAAHAVDKFLMGSTTLPR